jgi:hypothetical protein
MTMARKLAAATLFAAIAIGAAACEFGEHRGSHSNAYPEDTRYQQPPPQPAYQQPAYPVYQPAPVYRPAY